MPSGSPIPSWRLLLKLALRACERNDPAGASEALRGALALEPPTTASTSAVPKAMSIGAIAALLGYSPRHVRTLIDQGKIPPEAVLGGGRGTRVLVEPAIEALRSSRAERRVPADDVEREGLEHVERRRHRASPRRTSKE